MSSRSFTDQINLFGESSLKSRTTFVGTIILLGALFAAYSDYNLATGSGNLSMALFITANIYYPTKRIRLHYNIKSVQPFFNTFLVCHHWLNTASFLAACFHCYITPWSNNWLMFALFLMGWLTVGGYLLWIKYPPAKVRKGIYIVHTQQGVFFLLIFAMLKGHYVF
jgi:hypothetical protein